MNTKALTESDLKLLTPSIFSNSHGPGLSPNLYLSIPTWDIVKELEGEGWKPIFAMQPKAYKNFELKREFNRHMLGFLKTSDIESQASTAEVLPMMFLRNSNDGSTGFYFYAGLYRLVCSNGLVVGDTLLPPVEIRHMTCNSSSVAAFHQSIISNYPLALEKVKGMQKRILTLPEKREFARRAIELRWKEAIPGVMVEDLLKPRRPEDQGDSLWKVFNVVQEHFTKGGILTWHPRKRSKTVPINNTDLYVRVNSELFNLALNFQNN